MRELRLIRAGRLAWHEREPSAIERPGDAIVRPFLAGRCDGETLPIPRPACGRWGGMVADELRIPFALEKIG